MSVCRTLREEMEHPHAHRQLPTGLWLCRVFMVRATWLQPQTRYSDTEAGASRIVLQASMHHLVLQHVPLLAMLGTQEMVAVLCDQRPCTLSHFCLQAHRHSWDTCVVHHNDCATHAAVH